MRRLRQLRQRRRWLRRTPSLGRCFAPMEAAKATQTEERRCYAHQDRRTKVLRLTKTEERRCCGSPRQKNEGATHLIQHKSFQDGGSDLGDASEKVLELRFDECVLSSHQRPAQLLPMCAPVCRRDQNAWSRLHLHGQ